jgi:hypothetical protein
MLVEVALMVLVAFAAVEPGHRGGFVFWGCTALQDRRALGSLSAAHPATRP